MKYRSNHGNALVVVLGIVLVAGLWLSIWLNINSKPLKNKYYKHFLKLNEARAQSLWKAELERFTQVNDTIIDSLENSKLNLKFLNSNSNHPLSIEISNSLWGTQVQWRDSSFELNSLFHASLVDSFNHSPILYAQTSWPDGIDQLIPHTETPPNGQNLRTVFANASKKSKLISDEFKTLRDSLFKPDNEFQTFKSLSSVNSITDSKVIPVENKVHFICSEVQCNLKNKTIVSQDKIQFEGPWILENIYLSAPVVTISEYAKLKHSTLHTTKKLSISNATIQSSKIQTNGVVRTEHTLFSGYNLWFSMPSEIVESDQEEASVEFGPFTKFHGLFIQVPNPKKINGSSIEFHSSSKAQLKGVFVLENPSELEGALKGVVYAQKLHCNHDIQAHCVDNLKWIQPFSKITAPTWLYEGLKVKHYLKTESWNDL